MKIIYREPQSGKTTELVKIAAEDFLYFVCRNFQDCKRIEEIAESMKLTIPCPITVDEFMNRGFYGKNINGFVIDCADHVLQLIAGGVPIVAISMDKQKDAE